MSALNYQLETLFIPCVWSKVQRSLCRDAPVRFRRSVNCYNCYCLSIHLLNCDVLRSFVSRWPLSSRLMNSRTLKLFLIARVLTVYDICIY